MNEGKQKTGRISQLRICPFETPAGQRLEIKGVNGRVCFIEGKKRRGKRGRRDNPTLRIGNPSIISPTYT
jgi:hypothetical protein